MPTRSTAGSLRLIKVVHTLVWALFAGCVFVIPVFAAMRRLDVAAALIGVILLEELVLAFNSWRCPLTDVAARYTEDRHDNFDIYLPLWIARYNKQIFGSIYVFGILLTIAQWMQLLPDFR